jgi:DNA mismatch repair ATPase MutS
MKAFLMHPDMDFDTERPLPPNEPYLTQDLELTTLLDAMAAGDRFLFDVARRAVLLSLTAPEAITYRQQLLKDCLENPALVRQLYELATEAIAAEKKVWGSPWRDSPNSIVYRSVQVLDLLAEFLKRLRKIADHHVGEFRSQGFSRFFAMLTDELDDQYLALVERQLGELKFRSGMLISAQLGSGNRGISYMLRRPREQGWREWVPFLDRSGYSFSIPDRDENGFRALRELQDKGLNLVADALAQSADHIVSFFTRVRIEIGFYAACLNLHDRLTEGGETTCFPVPAPPGEDALSTTGLYDACLALTVDHRVTGNEMNADRKSLTILTGANQGGKSTFLRAVGLAQLMTQAGMFVPAASFRASVRNGVFTHYKREEDETMESGKLDEELRRMSDIADSIAPNCMLLCNESFASTNEREGSEIARQVVRAMVDQGVRVLFVTHQFDLAHGFYAADPRPALFLRAQREANGDRTFKIIEGEPLPTSYGEDSYRKVFGEAIAATASVAPGRAT